MIDNMDVLFELIENSDEKDYTDDHDCQNSERSPKQGPSRGDLPGRISFYLCFSRCIWFYNGKIDIGRICLRFRHNYYFLFFFFSS